MEIRLQKSEAWSCRNLFPSQGCSCAAVPSSSRPLYCRWWICLCSGCVRRQAAGTCVQSCAASCISARVPVFDCLFREKSKGE